MNRRVLAMRQAYGSTLSRVCPTCGAAIDEFCTRDAPSGERRARRIPCVKRALADWRSTKGFHTVDTPSEQVVLWPDDARDPAEPSTRQWATEGGS